MSTGLKANSDGSAAIQVGGTDVITLTSGGAATFVTSPTTVQAGTAAAPSITFSGDTNTGIYSPGADTIAFTEGGVESMRIDSSGNLLVGRTTTLLRNSTGTLIQPLTTTIASNSNGMLRLGNYSPTVSADIGGLILFDAVYRNSDSDSTDIASIAGLRETATSGNYAGYLAFSTTPNGGSRTERARITSGGDFYVGDTNNTLGNTRLYIKGDGTNPASRIWANTSTTSVYGLVVRHESTTAGAYIQFVTDTNVETGRIYDLAGTMQYASSSDARLKTNVQPMQNSLQSVLALNPCTFDMRRGEDTFIPSAGLIAQEVHDVYPFVVGIGGDDENTNPWSVDYGKLTPLLVAAIKEQQAMIDELKAKVAALEGA